MTTKNYATAKYYNAICGTKSRTIAYSNINVSGIINNIDGNIVNVYAIDSRNNQSYVSKSMNILEYTEISIQEMKFDRVDGIGTKVKIIGNGKYHNINFGAVTNTIKTIQYRKKEKTATEWGVWTSIKGLFTINTETGIFTINTELATDTFEFGIEYDVQMKVTDELSSDIETIDVNSGEILIDMLKGKGVNFGGIYDESMGGALQLKGEDILKRMYPIGSIYMSVNNTNPHGLFGGIWVLWGAGRVPVGVDTSQADFNTVEKTGGEKMHILTIEEIAPHYHSADGWVDSGAGAYFFGSNNNTGTKYEGSLFTKSTGGGLAHNNLQPYITCYMWKRTS